ncbi:MAG: trimethylamine methyltransferase family protein [Candidatus Lokiarchaeota archaeon]|nr:trimethylamine methyltransferase family protein [Candidatus Lokiarchaeota archaeon]
MGNDARKSSVARPRYRLLDDGQIERIHATTLKILEETGVRVADPEGIRVLEEAGCAVEKEDIVRIPRGVVEACIESAPSRIDIYDRKGEPAMVLEGRNSYFGLGTDLPTTVDLETGEARRSVLQDVVNAARVADFCPNIDFIASFALPGDVPTNTMYVECFKAEVENSTKPIFFTAAGKDDLEYIARMARAVAGGMEALRQKPFLIHYSEPVAPLTHSKGAVDKLLFCAENGIPICYIPTVLLGASGPVTLAGGITQANAEALSGIVMHQLKKGGAPIVSGWAVVPLDMKSMTYCYGSPEVRLTNAAFADIYHHYEIPCWGIVGTDSHVLDQQAAMEHAFAELLAAMDGANLIHDVGYLGQGLLGSPASIVMCDEIVSYIRRFMKGFEISEETLALDLIDKNSPLKAPQANFLAERHTLKHFRTEIWRPAVCNRDMPDAWRKKGGKTYGQRVVEKAREILKHHSPASLDPGVVKVLAAIVGEARTGLEGKKFNA